MKITCDFCNNPPEYKCDTVDCGLLLCDECVINGGMEYDTGMEFFVRNEHDNVHSCPTCER